MQRLSAEEARGKTEQLLSAAGLDDEKAQAIARRLVEADLFGHRTHGLQYLPTYLERLADGRIARTGKIEVLADAGGHFSWHTPRLPGAWVMEKLVAQAIERSATYPVVTATLANCSHIGALQVYLEDIGRRGLLALLMVTDPGVVSVAPPGGTDPVITTNPIAACIPTDGDPILIDQTTSLVSNGAVAQHAASGQMLPGHWVLDHQGHPSRDPDVLFTQPPGTLMPLGGSDFGYKGFAFGLLVEAFALALSGFGRDQQRLRGAQGVFLQLIDPADFGKGRHAFLTATAALVAHCKASRPVDAATPIRLPGERALRGKREQAHTGIPFPTDLLSVLDQWAHTLGTSVHFTTT